MRNIKAWYLYKFPLFIFAIILQGCQSNEIYLDADNQQICSANSKRVTSLRVRSDDAKESYSIIWNEVGRQAPRRVSLIPLTDGYIIKKGWSETTVDRKNFTFEGGKIYMIERGGGDAAKFSIKILTDNTGNVLKQID